LLDAEDRIRDWGGPNWLQFASENGASELAARNIAGQSIYDHVAGHFTKKFLREFLSGVRDGAGPTSRTYRCDSPKVKRLMEMRARKGERGYLSIEHKLVAEQPLAVEVTCEESPPARSVDTLRCSICNRLRRSGGGEWREPDEYERKGQVKVVHTVCTDCRSGLAAQLPLRPLTAV
jgi:hypothetical protein